jgi:hypothetical protein
LKLHVAAVLHTSATDGKPKVHAESVGGQQGGYEQQVGEDTPAASPRGEAMLAVLASGAAMNLPEHSLGTAYDGITWSPHDVDVDASSDSSSSSSGQDV